MFRGRLELCVKLIAALPAHSRASLSEDPFLRQGTILDVYVCVPVVRCRVEWSGGDLDRRCLLLIPVQYLYRRSLKSTPTLLFRQQYVDHGF